VSSSSNESERKETAEVGEEAMPLPVDAKVIFLGGIFFILFLTALYAVADIVWPLILAFVLSLLLKPPMRLLARLRVSRVLCAVLFVVVFWVSPWA
jgi:predicted PurR-regulated permease PerM